MARHESSEVSEGRACLRKMRSNFRMLILQAVAKYQDVASHEHSRRREEDATKDAVETRVRRAKVGVKVKGNAARPEKPRQAMQRPNERKRSVLGGIPGRHES